MWQTRIQGWVVLGLCPNHEGGIAVIQGSRMSCVLGDSRNIFGGKIYTSPTFLSHYRTRTDIKHHVNVVNSRPSCYGQLKFDGYTPSKKSSSNLAQIGTYFNFRDDELGLLCFPSRARQSGPILCETNIHNAWFFTSLLCIFLTLAPCSLNQLR